MNDDDTLLHRAKSDFLIDATKLVVDYNLLNGASRESKNIYLDGLKKVVEGAILIIAEYEENEIMRDIYEQVAELIKHDSIQKNINIKGDL